MFNKVRRFYFFSEATSGLTHNMGASKVAQMIEKSEEYLPGSLRATADRLHEAGLQEEKNKNVKDY
jgi:hypothetical protein